MTQLFDKFGTEEEAVGRVLPIAVFADVASQIPCGMNHGVDNRSPPRRALLSYHPSIKPTE